MTLDEAKTIVHRVLRIAHMEERLPKWTPRIELAHKMVREDEERKKAIDQENQTRTQTDENRR